MVNRIRDLDSCLIETRDEVEGFNIFTNSSGVYIRLNKHRKKFFYCSLLLNNFRLSLIRYNSFSMTFPAISDRGFMLRPSFPTIWPAEGKNRRFLFRPQGTGRYLKCGFILNVGTNFLSLNTFIFSGMLRHGSPHNLHNLTKWHLKRIVLISRHEFY